MIITLTGHRSGDKVRVETDLIVEMRGRADYTILFMRRQNSYGMRLAGRDYTDVTESIQDILRVAKETS